MGDFLRDAYLSFLTIDENGLKEIDGDLKDILAHANQNAPAASQANLSYILRYDGMGIIRRDFEEITRSFNRAKKVERVIFQLTSPGNSLNKGKSIHINLDGQALSNCLLVVADDDEAWVDSIFGRLKGRLDRYQNGNWFPHSTFVELLIQLLGVSFGFSLSLIGADLLSPHVSIKYSFFVLFVGLFLVFSNLWTYMLKLIGTVRTYFWPYISFKRRPIGIVGQTVIGFVLTSLLTALLHVSWNILKNVGTILTK